MDAPSSLLRSYVTCHEKSMSQKGAVPQMQGLKERLP